MNRTVLFASLAVAAPFFGSADAIAQQSNEFRWSGRVEPGRAIEIRGLNGEIRAERALGPDVEVVAIKTARRSDPASVTVEVIPHPDGVTICSLYPAPSNRPANQCSPGRSSMNVRDNDVE